jgi:hypothetical protein
MEKNLGTNEVYANKDWEVLDNGSQVCQYWSGELQIWKMGHLKWIMNIELELDTDIKQCILIYMLSVCLNMNTCAEV